MKIVISSILFISILFISGCVNNTQTCSKKKDISFKGVYSSLEITKKNEIDKTKNYQLLLKQKVNKNKRDISECCLHNGNTKVLLKKNRYYILSRGKFNNEDFGDISININEANSNSISNLNKFSKKIIKKFAIAIVEFENSYQKMSKIGETAIINIITEPNYTNKHIAHFLKTKNNYYYSCKIFYLEKYLTSIVKNIDAKITKKKIHSIIEKVIKDNKYPLSISGK